MKTKILIELSTGSVIAADVARIEELDIITCLAGSLEKCGAKVKDVSVIHIDDVSDRFAKKFKEVME